MEETPKVVVSNLALLGAFVVSAGLVFVPGPSAELGWAAVVAMFVLAPVLTLHSFWALHKLRKSNLGRHTFVWFVVPIISVTSSVALMYLLLRIIYLASEIREDLMLILG